MGIITLQVFETGMKRERQRGCFKQETVYNT